MIFQIPELSPTDAAVVEQIDQFREKLRYAIATPKRWTGLLRREAVARAIRGSNLIEGYRVSIDDAAAAADNGEPLEAKGETWDAITGYRDALTYILQLEGDPHFRYSDALLRSLHFMMMKYDLAKHPGQWRPGPIRVVDQELGQVVYSAPDAQEVPGLMQQLVESLSASHAAPAMVRGALAHLNLAMIHPFSDGNGRMARSLQTLVLAREGILNPAFCSIEEYLGRHQTEYYGVLAEVGGGIWTPDRDTGLWVRFCLTAHYRSAKELLNRTAEMQLLWDEVEAARRGAGLPERSEAALVTAALGQRVHNAFYRSSAEVSEQVASRELKRLVDSGLLLSKGERRARIYVAAPRLLELREKIRQPFDDADPYDLAD